AGTRAIRHTPIVSTGAETNLKGGDVPDIAFVTFVTEEEGCANCPPLSDNLALSPDVTAFVAEGGQKCVGLRR
ncbi:hypothetical protein, partial [Mycobacterium colombiense]|uniref:hypothetical protein n=1 Tax=Mycobacterium colombiense TaxID=339268 RepID=UPI000AC9EC2A